MVLMWLQYAFGCYLTRIQTSCSTSAALGCASVKEEGLGFLFLLLHPRCLQQEAGGRRGGDGVLQLPVRVDEDEMGV